MCVLRVSGKRFDPWHFLADSTLEPYPVFRAGDPRFPTAPDGKRHEMSGFKVKVSSSSWESLNHQVADAIAFLKKHKRSLSSLQSIRGVDLRLDFPVHLQIDRKNVFTQYDYFPPELVSLAGALRCGLEISIYPRDLLQLARAARTSIRTPGNGGHRKGQAKKTRRR